MAQAVRKSVDVEQLKQALQRQGITLSADKAARLASAIETRLAAGCSGLLKAYDVSWTEEKLTIVPAEKLRSSFHGAICFNALLPREGLQTVHAEALPDGSNEFVIVGGQFIAFLEEGELKALWPPIAESGEGAGHRVYAGAKN